MKNSIIICGLFVMLASCMPAHLAKYRKSSTRDSQSDMREPVAARGQVQAQSRGPKQATIYAVDKQTFRFMMKDEKVWSAAVDVLMRNYNLTIVDRKSGIITTEWDSFYQDNKVYRNRVSIRVAKRSWNQADLMIINNVEHLRDGSKGSFSSVWLPFEDKNGEAARIIQNMALVLKQPPPILPPGMKIAKGALKNGSQEL